MVLSILVRLNRVTNTEQRISDLLEISKFFHANTTTHRIIGIIGRIVILRFPLVDPLVVQTVCLETRLCRRRICLIDIFMFSANFPRKKSLLKAKIKKIIKIFLKKFP